MASRDFPHSAFCMDMNCVSPKTAYTYEDVMSGEPVLLYGKRYIPERICKRICPKGMVSPYCSECGAYIGTADMFCHDCGARIDMEVDE